MLLKRELDTAPQQDVAVVVAAQGVEKWVASSDWTA